MGRGGGRGIEGWEGGSQGGWEEEDAEDKGRMVGQRGQKEKEGAEEEAGEG